MSLRSEHCASPRFQFAWFALKATAKVLLFGKRKHHLRTNDMQKFLTRLEYAFASKVGRNCTGIKRASWKLHRTKFCSCSELDGPRKFKSWMQFVRRPMKIDFRYAERLHDFVYYDCWAIWTRISLAKYHFLYSYSLEIIRVRYKYCVRECRNWKWIMKYKLRNHEKLRGMWC